MSVVGDIGNALRTLIITQAGMPSSEVVFSYLPRTDIKDLSTTQQRVTVTPETVLVEAADRASCRRDYTYVVEVSAVYANEQDIETHMAAVEGVESAISHQQIGRAHV